MFTQEELKNLYIILQTKANFNLTGAEMDVFVKLKQRVLEEVEKLSKE